MQLSCIMLVTVNIDQRAMRIAFVGKGGSGKTTLSSLFILHLAGQGRIVLAIDADINQHLGAALGIHEEDLLAIPPLADDLRMLKEHLRGKNPRILSAEDMVKTTPPGTGSRLLRLDERNPVFSVFGRRVAGATLLRTGEFSDTDIGVRCYHSKTGAAELLLNHIVDRADEYVVVDMTAGADAFASGLFTRFDLTAVVVEPTIKSLGVYEQYKRYAEPYGVHLVAIGNKVETTEDKAFLEERLGDALLTYCPRSTFVRAGERGESPAFKELEQDIVCALDATKTALDTVPKDWQRFNAHGRMFHAKNAVAWANASVGRDLRDQIDPTFAYPA